ncbi:CortBP2 domain-containing protein [Meloidogyne graminicola]|uniref:CortBP2 domain-containing protein n=1 Tax=Meloidogyne graminicola TaxID=189291 RepID=A0A8T0A2Q9_9BILA|nr:CortBP2 domain-containing protein [Meloidogyne graminicola]
MNNEDKNQVTLHYTYQNLLDLFCTYEGELQARDVIIDCLLNKQQFTSSSTTFPSTTYALQSLAKDSLYVNDSTIKSVNRNCCSSCSNNILATAKFILSQREADVKIQKCLDLLSNKHSKCMEELSEKHQNIVKIARGDDKYIKQLETELDALAELLITRHKELNKLEEEKAKIEQKYLEEREREKIMVLFLLEERAKLFEEINELKNKTCTAADTSSNTFSNLKLLEEENKQLRKSLRLVHSEKTILQKRLDFLLRDLQQNEFQRQFQFLQPRTSSISEKEMILIGTNNTLPPSFPTTNDKSGRINRSIKNSSSFPQSFDNTEQLKQLQAQRPPIDRRKNQQQQHGHCSNNFNSVVVPLIVGHSTTLINTKMSSPPQQPKTNAYNLNNNNNQFQKYRGNPNVINNSGTFEQIKKYSQQQQPQTVICRRSTSLPRRIISSAQSFPSSKQFSEHQRNNFYQKPPLMGTNYSTNNNKNN